MANAIYAAYKAAMLSALVSGTLKVALVSITTGPSGSNYVYAAGDQYFSAVPAGAIVAAGVALTGKVAAVSGSSGVLTASSVVFPTVAAPSGPSAGQTGQALVFYIDTGTASTSPLVAYEDTETGLPVTPNGANITVSFSSNVLALT